MGGTGASGAGTSGGAGFTGNALEYNTGSYATEARSFVNGGIGSQQRTSGGHGGFGGGGAGAFGGGGGGGYSGGGSGHYSPARDQGGGGGGSYNAGTNQSNTAGANNTHGKVTITWIGN